MKYLSVTFLLVLTLLVTGIVVFASNDHKTGYQSKFYGIIEQLPAGLQGTWIVNGRQVEIGPRTEIEEEYGQVAVGAYVEIEGSSNGQIFYATEIEVKQGVSGHAKDNSGKHPNKFYGTIKTIPQGKLGPWMIDDREVIVDEYTRIENKYDRLKVGAQVEVKGLYRKGAFYARKIEVK